MNLTSFLQKRSSKLPNFYMQHYFSVHLIPVWKTQVYWWCIVGVVEPHLGSVITHVKGLSCTTNVQTLPSQWAGVSAWETWVFWYSWSGWWTEHSEHDLQEFPTFLWSLKWPDKHLNCCLGNYLEHIYQ